MFCPFCGKEMEPGNLNSSVYTRRAKVRFISKEEQKKKGLFAWQHRRSYVIEVPTGYNLETSQPAYHCPDCRKVFLELDVDGRSYWDENY